MGFSGPIYAPAVASCQVFTHLNIQKMAYASPACLKARAGGSSSTMALSGRMERSTFPFAGSASVGTGRPAERYLSKALKIVVSNHLWSKFRRRCSASTQPKTRCALVFRAPLGRQEGDCTILCFSCCKLDCWRVLSGNNNTRVTPDE